jgi:(E)-4-hydroxy-3-methylbut-2-enyl-diphosphate synthase
LQRQEIFSHTHRTHRCTDRPPSAATHPRTARTALTTRTVRAQRKDVQAQHAAVEGLGLRTRGVRVVSCPSCARQGFDVIRTVQKLEDALQHIKTPMSLSVLGCVVNGPGEARETDIGITGGGNGKHMVYLAGVTDHHVEDDAMVAHIVKLVEAKAAEIDAGTTVSMDTLHGKAA